VVYPVLEFREEKQTFTKVEGGNVDFFLLPEIPKQRSKILHEKNDLHGPTTSPY
jgi:hypothetical protein